MHIIHHMADYISAWGQVVGLPRNHSCTVHFRHFMYPVWGSFGIFTSIVIYILLAHVSSPLLNQHQSMAHLCSWIPSLLLLPCSLSGSLALTPMCKLTHQSCLLNLPFVLLSCTTTPSAITSVWLCDTVSVLAAMRQLLEKWSACSLHTHNVPWLFPCHLNFGYSMLWLHVGPPRVPCKATHRFPSFPLSPMHIYIVLYRLFTVTSVGCSIVWHWDNSSV